MTITIPAWLLWSLGIAAGSGLLLFVGLLALLGWEYSKVFARKK